MSKWTVRVLPTVKDYAAKYGKAPAGLSFSLAALLDFYRGTFAANGEYQGQREQGNYPIKDNADILTIMQAAWDGAIDMNAVATKLLADTRLWGEDLTRVPGLVEQVSTALNRIQAVGVKAAMSELCS